jgi:transposase
MAMRNELYEKTLHIEKLKLQLAALRRARFGRSSERLDREIEQLEFLIGEMEGSGSAAGDNATADAAGTEPVATPAQDSEKCRPVRLRLPDHLPRERVEHRPPHVCPRCQGTRFCVFGTDEREMLEYVPSHFKAVVHARPRLSCRECEYIFQAEMPSLPIERGLPGPGLLAHVLASKYADHIPLHRQCGIYARAGVDIDKNTMVDWVGKMADLMEPLVDEIAAHVRKGETIHVDDTPVRVQAPGRGKTKEGRFWVALRDERPWGSGVPPAVLYEYAPDRKAERAESLLRGCRGYLHADAYAGYNQLYAVDPVTGTARLTEVACMAHARREIYEVHKATGSARARQLLELIAQLFMIEGEIKGRLPEERRAVRQERALPLLARIKREMECVLAQTSAKASLAKAVRYSLTRWAALTRYVEDGRLEICNNAVERALRPVAIGRKNWMFAGSDAGGVWAARIYTIIQTARLNGVDPEGYLRNVIGRIAAHPSNRVAELLPWNIQLAE